MSRKIPPEILKELRRKQQAGLYAVAVELTNRAKVIATRHSDNGTRRNSITQTKSDDGRSVLWGIPTGAAPHAQYLELGFTPHWVPGRHIGLWMTRNNVGSGQVAHATLHGVTRRKRYTSRRTLKTVRSQALGLFVGGPGSTLQYGGGGATMTQFHGPRRIRVTYRTKGGKSKFLKGGKVGHPILQPAAETIRSIPIETYKRGFENAR